MIKAIGVTKEFDGFLALNNLSLNVKKGTVYGLVGPNGAGKTTVIKHLTGVYKPESGKILIDGENIYENIDLKQRVVNIPDELFFFATFNIKEMAKFYSGIYKNFNFERFSKIKEIFNIDEKRQVSKLSKGMKKQVAFWLSISAMPDVLILDEPVDGLDPVMRKQVLNLIMQDVSERNMTVLISSHNLRELEDICDYVGIIHKGEMVMEKELDSLKGDIHKYQLAFNNDAIDELSNRLTVLRKSKIGAIYNLIIKGNIDEIQEIINEYNPIICEAVSLTLEEVFIYELGGLGYDFKNIII